jgi:hypothetical protein
VRHEGDWMASFKDRMICSRCSCLMSPFTFSIKTKAGLNVTTRFLQPFHVAPVRPVSATMQCACMARLLLAADTLSHSTPAAWNTDRVTVLGSLKQSLWVPDESVITFGKTTTSWCLRMKALLYPSISQDHSGTLVSSMPNCSPMYANNVFVVK